MKRQKRKRQVWLLALPAAVALWWLLRPARSKPEVAATTERDGLGPATLRRYWADIEHARKTPEEVVQAVLNDFASIMPRPLAMTWKVRGQENQGQKGDRYFILMLVRPGFVETEVVEPLRFRNRTLRLHSESGWVEFQAIPDSSSRYRLQVQSSVRTTTLLDRLAYKLGMANAQSYVWHTVLDRAAKLSGGTVVNTGRATGEFDTVPGGVKPPETPGDGTAK